MISTAVSIAFALTIVLALVTLTLRGLNRITEGSRSRGVGRDLEVLDRTGIGPKQGVALVRAGERVVLVSFGDGGIRMLTEVERESLAAGDAKRAPAASADTLRPLPEMRRIVSALRRTAAAIALIGAALAIDGLVTPGLEAQAAPAEVAAPAEPRTAPMGVPQIDLQLGEEGEGLQLTGAVGVVVMLGLLTLLPALLLLMTAFTRILIVLHLLKQALGTQSSPPAHLVGALALLLTFYVMGPTLTEFNEAALTPWMDGEIEQVEMLERGVEPFREFMLSQVRESDLATFVEMGMTEAPGSVEEVPLHVLMSAFAVSELRAAFQMGFALFLPFIVIDLVVAAVLMSMGMFMLPPAMISLPFKLLLFVLVDGWSLVIQGLVSSFS